MALKLFGWELLYNSVIQDIKNNQDILVCFTHLVLISNGFKCVGLGDSKNLDGTEIKSETLPKGWNDDYAIRYVFEGRLYNLRGTNVDDAIMINLIRVQERSVNMVQLNNRAVFQSSGALDQMVPNNQELAQIIKKQLIDNISISTNYKDNTSQTLGEDPSRHSTIPTTPSVPLLDRHVPFRRDDPFGVGRSDLDPLGGFIRPLPGLLPNPSGGMLFVPPRGPRLDPAGPNLGIPPGSLPPGARFDPFRPPDVDPMPRPLNRPDNDEFPPPGFDDVNM